MTHLDISNTYCDQKKGRESNWQFDSRPVKVKNHLESLVWRWRVTYHWKALDKGYIFSLNLISSEGLHTKLWASKVAGISTLGILRLPFGSPGTKWHLGADPVVKHIIYYKGEGGGFPQVRVVVSFVSPCLPMVCPCTKCFNYALSNLLFGLCKYLWIIELLVNILSPISELQHTPLPTKCYKLGSVLQLLLLPMSSPLDS
jgi:hypothetical protein